MNALRSLHTDANASDGVALLRVKRELSAGLRDPRVRLIPVLRVRAVGRLLRGEFAHAPTAVVVTLLVLVGSLTYVALRIVALANASGRHALFIAGGCLALLAATHNARRDRGLLKRIGISLPVLFAVEYLLLLLPIAVLLAWSGRGMAALATLAGAMVVAGMPSGARRTLPTGLLRRIRLPLPERAFE